ncbi:MAG: hypothetical protein RL557_582 [archaeon]|jgi:hypothetical protein
MKQIKGYVFIPEFKETTFRSMFGPSTGGEQRSYSNLNTNGITPFSHAVSVRNSARDYFSDFKSMAINKIERGTIDLFVAESVEELEQFREKDSLIMIIKPCREYETHRLNGPVTNLKSYHGVLPFQELEINGFTAFTMKNSKNNWTSYERAEYALREANRQCQAPATIALFNLSDRRTLFSK